MMIKDCTILIITHNRHFLLKRSIKYYLCYFSKIIVLDSSVNSIYLDKKIKYEYLPKKSIIEKLLIGIKYCTTKYFLIVPDDDFIVPNGVIKAIKFLEKNKDFVTVSGDFYYFEKYSHLIKYKKINNYKYKSFDENHFLERLNSSIKGHSQMLYSIFNKKMFFKNLVKFKIFYKYTEPCELIFHILSLFSGKHKYIDSLWMIRDGQAYYNKLNFIKSVENKNNFFKKIVEDPNDTYSLINKKSFFKTKIYKTMLNVFFKLNKKKLNCAKKNQLDRIFKNYFISTRGNLKLYPKNYFFFKYFILNCFKFLFKYFYYVLLNFNRKKIFNNHDKKFIVSLEKIIFPSKAIF